MTTGGGGDVAGIEGLLATLRPSIPTCLPVARVLISLIVLGTPGRSPYRAIE